MGVVLTCVSQILVNEYLSSTVKKLYISLLGLTFSFSIYAKTPTYQDYPAQTCSGKCHTPPTLHVSM